MNRNTELHFSHTPQIDIKRSKFDESHNHKTTFNAGDIIPIYVDTDILPGDTVQLDQASLIRMATPIFPIMDNLYCDIYYFFVPHRLVFDKWKEFWGENDDPWARQTEYEVPHVIPYTNTTWKEGSIADYMGIPTKISGGTSASTASWSVNALAFRAYVRVWNDWFRDENLKQAAHCYTDEVTRTVNPASTSLNSYVTRAEFGLEPLKAAKFHDYFTSSLPAPQKGPAVQINMLENQYAPITTQNNPTAFNIPLQFNLSGGSIGAGTYHNLLLKNTGSSSTTDRLNIVADTVNASAPATAVNILGTNMYANLSAATVTTINNLRTAFAIQKYYENAAIHGTRYIEYIKGVFGVTSSDARMQRAEYLGGKRFPINIDQILQTSATNEVTPQGNASGFSCTIDKSSLFTHSFEEHGTLLGLAVIRTEHTYQQGLRRMWSRKKWLDFFNPFFAHISEQPVMQKEIRCTNNTTENKEAFGYQEAWADYRYKPSYVTGYMRSNADGTLDSWHFADYYTTKPTLSSEWIDETVTNIDRTISVTSQISHQFIADFYFKVFYTRPMPVYSIPGLIDHV